MNKIDLNIWTVNLFVHHALFSHIMQHQSSHPVQEVFERFVLLGGVSAGVPLPHH